MPNQPRSTSLCWLIEESSCLKDEGFPMVWQGTFPGTSLALLAWLRDGLSVLLYEDKGRWGIFRTSFNMSALVDAVVVAYGKLLNYISRTL